MQYGYFVIGLVTTENNTVYGIPTIPIYTLIQTRSWLTWFALVCANWI